MHEHAYKLPGQKQFQVTRHIPGFFKVKNLGNWIKLLIFNNNNAQHSVYAVSNDSNCVAANIKSYFTYSMYYYLHTIEPKYLSECQLHGTSKQPYTKYVTAGDEANICTNNKTIN